MDLMLLITIFLIVLVGGYLVAQRIKNQSLDELKSKHENNNELAIEDEPLNEVQVQFNMLSEIRDIDESRLVEIKDSRLLGHVNNLIPETFKTATSVGNTIQGSTTPLYEAILPAGKQLVKSRKTEGAFRGITMGKKGIDGSAEFIPANDLSKVAANVTSSAMNVGSMVVGQYYMTQINDELESISSNISQIIDFQNNEYKSKVFALVTKVKNLSNFQAEIQENEELRKAEISNLNYLEQQCTELLGQANLTVVNYSKKMDIDFKEYERDLSDIHYWVIYQETLIEVLRLIANLKYTLYLGTVSREQCNSLLSIYTKQVNDAIISLQNWHLEQIDKFGVNLEKGYRERRGIDGVIHKVPSMIKKELSYRPVNENLVEKVTKHLIARDKHRQVSTREVFEEDVKLIGKEGKIYYLPSESIN